MSRPSSLVANKGIELLTGATPNGFKASILLEELKEAYGTDYTVQAIDISTNVQKEPWFTAVNPNGRIPAIVDHDNGGLNVFEGSAILSYLTRRYDPEHRFSFAPDDNQYTVAEAWIGWQHGGLGPMQGQANHFVRFTKDKIAYPIQRYVGETERLYGILDARLADRDYVAGEGRGRYSIADIALIGWVAALPFTTISFDQFPNVFAWLRRVWARPAVKRGTNIPKGLPFDPIEGLTGEFKEKTDELRKIVDDAKKEFGYVYKSP
jgi:glutathione S-transferase